MVACSTPRTTSEPRPTPPDDSGLEVGGAHFNVTFEGTEPDLGYARFEQWVVDSASMINEYYGGAFPVPSLDIRLIMSGRRSIGFGMHNDGRWIKVYCGRRTPERGLRNDWVMVHEMLHACFPDLESRHRWMQEGTSTYVEKIVRARAGNRTDEQVWRSFAGSMHNGRPKRGDRGLDKTHTWGRTYWGGALFWLVADVDIRLRTNNEKSIRDALLTIVAEGGNGRANWSTKQVVEAGNRGTGTTAISDLYASMAKAPGDIDLDTLWKDLGVIYDEGTVTFDDDARHAHIRRAITRA